MAKFQPDEDLVRRLSSLLMETGLNEIEYEANGQRIRVARHAAGTVVWPGQQGAAGTAAAAAGLGEPVPAADNVPDNALLSPMVGTAYVAPEPGGKPFVSVGDQISEGQTVLIIEAMKVMNPIPAPRTGRITRILVGDGQPVEYGEPLMVID